MQTIRFRVTGFSPLLMHNPAGSMKGASSAMGTSKIPTAEEEAKRGTYKMPSGQLFVPSEAFRSSMIDGASGQKIGKFGAPGRIGGTTFVTTEECPLVHPTTGDAITEYVVDTRRAVVQGNGILRSRPKILEWATEVEFEYDPDFVPATALVEAFTIAGRAVGVGDYRPRPPKGPKAGKGGPFGRYTVERLAA